MRFIEYMIVMSSFRNGLCKTKFAVACDASGKKDLYLCWLPIENQMLFVFVLGNSRMYNV